MKSLKTALWLMFSPVILLFYAAEAAFFFLESVLWNIHDRFTRRKELEAQLFLVRLPEGEFEQGLEKFRAISNTQGCSPEETEKIIQLLREQKREAGDIV